VPVDRPTFSESWYRVSELRPRLRSTVQVHRQHYRGRMWHVLQDPSSNQFFRLNEAAYRFVALLDGRRNVADTWRICSDQLGDSAPTQGEAIQLLGQLYTSNLLHAELPPDAQGLFNRHQKRVHREVRGYLMNLLFIRIPLIDPDNFLNATVGMISWLFSWVGLLLWAGVITAGFYFVIGSWQALANRADSVLDVDNLPFLYLSFILIKVFHEFGHAYMCKTFGRRTGTGGEVHVMGIMFLVFTPMPYVDASSAWAFRSRRQRILVGMGGMIIELAMAAVAAIVWANTREGPLHTIAYNAMFIASVSTLLFNANPLLRYDGYYILSDMLEIPNLAQRSKSYLYYLVKKYAWNVRQARNPAHTRGERAWFVFYGIASTIYRVFICVRILLFIADKLFMLGLVLAVSAVVAWVLVPLGKFVHYLGTSGELMRVRFRAIASTAVVFGLIFVGIGLVPASDRFRLEGVVEPQRVQVVHQAADGFVAEFLASGQQVEPADPNDPNSPARPLLTARSRDLEAQHEELLAQRRQTEVRRRLARTEDIASAQILAEQLVTLQERIDRVEEEIASLAVYANFAGEWIAPKIERARGAYLRRGDKIGLVASNDLIIRATAGQEVAAMLLEQPVEQYVLDLPREQGAGLTAALAEAGAAGRELAGSLALADHPDELLEFVVERIDPCPGDESPRPPAADHPNDPTRPAETRPADANGATTSTAAGADPPEAPAAPTSGKPRFCRAHIRLKKTPKLLNPGVESLASITIDGQTWPDIRTRREVTWRHIEIRIKGRPDPLMTGRVIQVLQAGREHLPSAALGYAAGGSVRTDPKDSRGTKTTERFFEIRIQPDPIDDRDSVWYGKVPLLSGQRVVIRVEMPDQPLASQWYRSLLQLIQRRFQI
jgi:putative peptide zinc metalloprotease protein